MATGTFTYNALLTKALKSVQQHNAVSIGSTAVKPYLSICSVGLAWFERYCGKMYSRYLFFLGWIASEYFLIPAVASSGTEVDCRVNIIADI